MTGSKHATISLLALLFLPGTIIHELAHVLSAGVLLVHYGDIEFMPEIREDGVKLGSAEIGRTDPIRRALIGIAPVLAGVLIILGSLFLLTFWWDQGNSIPFWAALVLIYILFVVGNTMFSSKKDMEGTVEVLIVLACFFVAMYLLKFYQVFEFLAGLLTAGVVDFMKRANLFLLVPIIIDLLIFGLVKIVFPKR